MAEHPSDPVLDALQILGDLDDGEASREVARERIAAYAATAPDAGAQLAWGMTVLADLALQFLEVQAGVSREAFVAGMRHATDPDPGEPV
jgi:hypothetical protein